MKKQKSVLVLILAVLSLIGIGIIYLTGLFKDKPKETPKSESPNVLGELIESKISPSASADFNHFIQETVKNTQDAATAKVSEVQKTLVTTIEKEISTLTTSQVDALKIQICRDWGVVTVAPSKAPN